MNNYKRFLLKDYKFHGFYCLRYMMLYKITLAMIKIHANKPYYPRLVKKSLEYLENSYEHEEMFLKVKEMLKNKPA